MTERRFEQMSDTPRQDTVATSQFRARLERLEAWLWEEGFETLGLGRARPSDEVLADRVLEVSDLYTLERDQLGGDRARGSHLLARTLYYLAADAPKVHRVLAEVCERRAWSVPDRLSIADMGCGVGTTSVGALLSLPAGTVVTLRGVDSDPLCAGIWRSIVAQAARIAGIELIAEVVTGDLLDPDHCAPHAQPHARDRPSSHLILCQTSLNERLGPAPSGHVQSQPGEAAHDATTAAAVRHWCTLGTTIIIEPALRSTTRPLHRLRDALLRRGGEADAPIRVLAPCPHQHDCPMLSSARDWCHEIRTHQATPRVDAIQRLTRRRDERLKFSFVVFAPVGTADARRHADGPDARLVSDPLPSKGKVERIVCTASGTLRRLRVLDRERSSTNAGVADLPRGTLVTIAPAEAPDRLPPEAIVKTWIPEQDS